MEEAATTMCDYIRSHGIHERQTGQITVAAGKQPAVSPAAALSAALQVLSYPEAVTPDSLDRARTLVQSALINEHLK